MMKKTKFKKDWVTRGIAVCGFAVLGGLIIHIPAVASVLEEDKPIQTLSESLVSVKNLNEKLGSETENEKTISYYVDRVETQEDKLYEVSPENIKEVVIDKSSEQPSVNVTTKNSQDGDVSESEDNSADTKKGTVKNYPDAYLSVEKLAEYEGGESQLLKDLTETIHYPEEAKEQKIEGRVVVRFQINTNGTLSNCEVAYSQNPLLNEAAIKAVENLPGKWQPAEVDGKPVNSIFNMPVTFKLR